MMRGKHLHNVVLLAPVIAALRVAGLHVMEEAARPDGAGAVDLLVEDSQGVRIVIECETGAARVRWSALKAAALASFLVILVPDGRTAKKCRAALRRTPRLDRLSQLHISVLTYGALSARLPQWLSSLPVSRGREGRECLGLAARRGMPRGGSAAREIAADEGGPR